MHYVQTQCCIFVCFCCRPPHGGRGLKSPDVKPRGENVASPSTRKAQSETGGYIKYIRKHDNCLFIVLEQRFLNIETAPCSQIQDAAIIGLQYSKTSMLYARQLKSIIDIYSLSPFFHLLRMIFCIFSHEAMFQIFRSIRRKIPPFRYGRPPFRCL